MDNKAVLKPCPFCGGKADYDNCDAGSGKWYYCKQCGVKVKVPYGTDDEEHRAMWNKRSESSGFALAALESLYHAQTQRVKEMEKQLAAHAQHNNDIQGKFTEFELRAIRAEKALEDMLTVHGVEHPDMDTATGRVQVKAQLVLKHHTIKKLLKSKLHKSSRLYRIGSDKEITDLKEQLAGAERTKEERNQLWGEVADFKAQLEERTQQARDVLGPDTGEHVDLRYAIRLLGLRLGWMKESRDEADASLKEAMDALKPMDAALSIVFDHLHERLKTDKDRYIEMVCIPYWMKVSERREAVLKGGKT